MTSTHFLLAFNLCSIDWMWLLFALTTSLYGIISSLGLYLPPWLTLHNIILSRILWKYQISMRLSLLLLCTLFHDILLLALIYVLSCQTEGLISRLIISYFRVWCMTFDDMTVACLAGYWFVVIILHHWSYRFKVLIIFFIKCCCFICRITWVQLHLLIVSFEEIFSGLSYVIPVLSCLFKMLYSIFQLPFFLGHWCDVC